MSNPSSSHPPSSDVLSRSDQKSIRADILVIDDTPENLHLLASMLTERNYKVRSVTKGLTGLRGAIAAPPDLILLDINMPEVNGYEVCKQLKHNEITQHIPVIFISALDDVFDKVKAFNVGGVDFITKPFQIDEVLVRIRTHLTLSRLQKQQEAQTLRLQKEIDERRRAEETFEKAFLASPSPIAINDFHNDTFVAVNPSFLRLSDHAQEDVLGRTTTELDFWKEPALYQQALVQLSEGIVRNSLELECKTRQGEVHTVLLSLEKITLNEKSCVLTIINDITERKRLENEFISVVSHELRTPMHSLVGALDLLSTGELGELTEQGRDILSVATSNAERLIRLVNDILDLERLKLGETSLNRSHCNIENLCNQAIQAMQAMADKAKISLTVQAEPVSVHVDCDHMLQTLTNLLSNAIKFSPKGSTVSIQAALMEGVSDEANKIPMLHITVSDQGRGIPEDRLETIFERFQQVDASDSRKKGGTGLGLAICRKILQQHNGKIWAESTLNEGSIFHIYLPTQAKVPK